MRRWAGAALRDAGGRRGTVVLAAWVLAAVAAPLLASDGPQRAPIPFGPSTTFVASEGLEGPPPAPPSRTHWLGTDELGRDVAARLLHGARPTLVVALVATTISLLMGLLVGGLAGALGGGADVALSRLIELATCFPTLFFLVAYAAVRPDRTVWELAIVLGLVRWPDTARLVRAEVATLLEQDFVTAARGFGAGRLFILRRHLLPNALGHAAVAATFGFGGAVLLETSLTFLGLGVPAPEASWGALLADAQRTLVAPGAWWLAVFPGAAVASTVLAVNAIGEALRRTLDEGS